MTHQRQSPGRAGLTMIEVLVGLAVLGIVSGSLVALQVGSLRAARTAQATRQLAAAAEHQLVLARLLPSAVACRDLEGWPHVDTCELHVNCLTATCTLREVEVRVVSTNGREASWRTVVNDALEAAPTGALPEGTGEVGPLVAP